MRRRGVSPCALHPGLVLDASISRRAIHDVARDFISSVCFELGREGRLRRTSEEADIDHEVVKGER
jgi:hypothetical protein